MNLMNEMAQHRFGDFEICDNAIPHRSYGDNIAGGPSDHILGLQPHRQDAVFSTHIGSHSHNRWLAQHDSFTLDINQCIRCSKVYGKITWKDTQKFVEEKIHNTPIL